MNLKVRVLEGGLPLERRDDSAGYDCFARLACVINPLQRVIVPLGIETEFDPGYVALLFDRSSSGAKGITRMGGVVDASYRKEWGAILYNSTHEPFGIVAGARVIQCVFVKHESPVVTLTDVLSESTRTGGFGTTEISERLAKFGFRLDGPVNAMIVMWLEAMERGELSSSLPIGIRARES